MSSALQEDASTTHVVLIRVTLSLESSIERDVGPHASLEKNVDERLGSVSRNFVHQVHERLPSLTGNPLVLGLEHCVFRQEASQVHGHFYLSLSQPAVIEERAVKEAKHVLGACLKKALLLEVEALEQAIDLTHFELSRLSQISDLRGHASSEKPKIHYVVQTDVERGWELEIDRWYAQEHLPGLASVPGCVFAKRYVNLDEGPKSFACYGLLSQETLSSQEWLAVRATKWASQARPHFINTRRDIFCHVLAKS